LNNFISTLVRDVPLTAQEQTAAFYRRVLTTVVQAGHGTLAAVVSGKKSVLPTQFSGDAIPLAPPISVPEKILELLATEDCQANTQLLAYNAVITGMLLSDGITVFGSDGTARAYNVFVKHPPLKSAEATAGGARHRTFRVLSGLVTKGTLVAALMQSQDGRVEFAGSDHGEE
jgi:hypothetical protein